MEFATGVHGVDLTEGIVTRGGPARGRAGTADVSVDGRTVALTVARETLDDPEAIAVDVAAGREYADESSGRGGGDRAPGSGPFRYALADGGGWPWAWTLAGLALAAAVVLLAAGARSLGKKGLRPAL